MGPPSRRGFNQLNKVLKEIVELKKSLMPCSFPLGKYLRAYNRLEGQPSLVHGVTQLANRNYVITYVKETSSLARQIVKQVRERITRLT